MRSKIWVIVMATALFLAGQSRTEDKPIMRPAIPETVSPVERIDVTARDGKTTFAFVRRPPGEGPFPAVVFLHGSLRPSSEKQLRSDALNAATHTRFLAAGYATVTGTHRARDHDPQAPAYLDCVAVVEHIKKLPYVDAGSVAVMGGSGGGSLALEVAGETGVAAIALGEPATILFTGMFTKDTPREPTESFSARDARAMMADPQKFYTPELREFTRQKIKRIACPILIAHGDLHGLWAINREILYPELQRAGKTVEWITYPGQPHGFYFGRTPDQPAAKKFFDDCEAFFRRYVKAKPAPIDSSLLGWEPAGPPASRQ